MNYIKMLVDYIHSAVVATIAVDGYPQSRVIDMMLYDEQGVYFLTAKGKEFYTQLMEQKFIALSATKEKISVSLRGKVKNIGNKRLDEIFEKNTYMQGIYPRDTRTALEVFQIYEAVGEYFDISNPSCIVRDRFFIGDINKVKNGYSVGKDCTGCGLCISVCPQKCIDISNKRAIINSSHCLSCGRCAEACPKKTIKKAD